MISIISDKGARGLAMQFKGGKLIGDDRSRFPWGRNYRYKVPWLRPVDDLFIEDGVGFSG